MGPSGSGKTLLAMELLKMKIASYKSQRKPFEVILATFLDSPILLRDFQGKYNAGYIIDDYKIVPKTMTQLAKGRKEGNTFTMFHHFVLFLNFRIWI